MPNVVKAAISDVHARLFSFSAQKTSYGGKNIAVDGLRLLSC